MGQQKNAEVAERKVFAWTHIKQKNVFEAKSCLVIVTRLDSTGIREYYISEMFSDEKPFDKWNVSWIHYLPDRADTVSGLRFGYFDVHVERINHKPTKQEIYDLLHKWEFSLCKNKAETIEAGFDGRLWFDIFGFVPDKKELIH